MPPGRCGARHITRLSVSVASYEATRFRHRACARAVSARRTPWSSPSQLCETQHKTQLLASAYHTFLLAKLPYNTQPCSHAALCGSQESPPMYERFSQFVSYSYVMSHLGNDSCLPIYKTNLTICDTPHQTHCVGNSIFLHFVMVMTVLWAELWFVVECRALYKKKHLVGILPLSI
jgi:hypothetical protein